MVTREQVNEWLKARKIGQLTVQVRKTKRGGFRAFFCVYLKPARANIIEFIPYPYGADVLFLNAEDGVERTVAIETYKVS